MSNTEATESGLSSELRSPDAAVRWRVAAVLADLPGDESEGLLIQLLGDEDYRVRERAISALSRRFNPRVADACVEALADEENAGRRGAGLILLSKAGEEGRSRLLGLLESPAVDVRLAAATELPGPRADAAVVEALEAAVRRESDSNAKAALVLALGRTGRREAIAPLLAILEEGSLWLRVHALEALGEIGDPEVAPRLLPLLSHVALRRAVLLTLSHLPSSAAAEELVRRAAAGELDEALLAALRAAVETLPREGRERLRGAWPSAGGALSAQLERADATPEERTEAARLLAALDLPGAAGAIVKHGPFTDGFDALRRLAVERFTEALHAVLQAEDPEPALALIVFARAIGRAGSLTPLLVHQSPVVRSAALTALPPGKASLGEIIEVLAEEDAETALPAAYALAAEDPSIPAETAHARRGALLDRSKGADGPGRAAALLALADVDVPGVDSSLRLALTSPDPEVRRAAVRAAASHREIATSEIVALFTDAEPEVRAAALRSVARRGDENPIEWRRLREFLSDDREVAAAAGAAIIALAGSERAALVDEMLTQSDPIRRAALEEIPATGDASAAERAAVAVGHEDTETARAAIYALALCRSTAAEEALARSLEDARPEVRQAAAEVIASREAPESLEGLLSSRLAGALATEREASVRQALLAATTVAGGPAALEPLTAVLAAEPESETADWAALALARRYPEAVRRLWASAPARAERRWAKALAKAADRTEPA